MWQTKYASVAPKNFGVGVNFRQCSEGYFISGRPQSRQLHFCTQYSLLLWFVKTPTQKCKQKDFSICTTIVPILGKLVHLSRYQVIFISLIDYFERPQWLLLGTFVRKSICDKFQVQVPTNRKSENVKALLFFQF